MGDSVTGSKAAYRANKYLNMLAVQEMYHRRENQGRPDPSRVSVSGMGGRVTASRIADTLLWGLALLPGEAADLMYFSPWNDLCCDVDGAAYPWSREDLFHICASVSSSHEVLGLERTNPRGFLLRDGNPSLDVASEWLHEYCEVDPSRESDATFKVKGKELYTDFFEWCQRQGMRFIPGKFTFYEDLHAKGVKARRVEGSLCFCGIRKKGSDMADKQNEVPASPQRTPSEERCYLDGVRNAERDAALRVMLAGKLITEERAKEVEAEEWPLDLLVGFVEERSIPRYGGCGPSYGELKWERMEVGESLDTAVVYVLTLSGGAAAITNWSNVHGPYLRVELLEKIPENRQGSVFVRLPGITSGKPNVKVPASSLRTSLASSP